MFVCIIIVFVFGVVVVEGCVEVDCFVISSIIEVISGEI